MPHTEDKASVFLIFGLCTARLTQVCWPEIQSYFILTGSSGRKGAATHPTFSFASAEKPYGVLVRYLIQVWAGCYVSNAENGITTLIYKLFVSCNMSSLWFHMAFFVFVFNLETFLNWHCFLEDQIIRTVVLNQLAHFISATSTK